MSESPAHAGAIGSVSLDSLACHGHGGSEFITP